MLSGGWWSYFFIALTVLTISSAACMLFAAIEQPMRPTAGDQVLVIDDRYKLLILVGIITLDNGELEGDVYTVSIDMSKATRRRSDLFYIAPKRLPPPRRSSGMLSSGYRRLEDGQLDEELGRQWDQLQTQITRTRGQLKLPAHGVRLVDAPPGRMDGIRDACLAAVLYAHPSHEPRLLCL